MGDHGDPAVPGLPWRTLAGTPLIGQGDECFDQRGTYTPLEVEGDERQRVVAFQRGDDLLCIAPRLTWGLVSWGDTRVRLPRGRFVELFSGRSPDSGHLEPLLERFPVALLLRS